LCWLWAFPEVFPWSNAVAWLYTPVVGNKRWPGDLWGIDSVGNLLIIEVKQCKRRNDPFIDFIEFHHPPRKELSAVHWQEKWEKHYESEISYKNGWEERPQGKTDGILPRSNKRSHLRRWPALAKQIDHQIRSQEYVGDVQRFLQLRDQLHNPAPYYFALMIETDERHPILTEAGKKSARTLQNRAGKDQVRVTAVHCKRIDGKKGSVEARVIDW